MSNLLDNIGKGFEKNNLLHNRNTITIYVENEDDIPFWKHIFMQFPLKTSITATTNEEGEEGLKRGKENVLRFATQANRVFLLCVDSDYDYLMNGKTEKSRLINENPFIFQTYTYAIENHKCYAESLHAVLVEATQNDNEVFDYQFFMQNYSETIYELFLYSVYYECQDQLANEIHKKEYQIKKQELSATELEIWQKDNLTTHIFPIEQEFCKQICLLNQFSTSEKATEELETLRKKIATYLQSLPKIDETILNNLKVELATLGVLPQNTYLFIQGHTLYKNVVLMFLKPAFEVLKSAKLSEFAQLAAKNENSEIINKNELKSKQNEYKKFVFKAKEDEMSGVERVLATHKLYENCFLMDKIHNDIKNYMENI